MPANLTPDYRKAEEAYRSARDPLEKLDHLKEMLRTIPKHKGTDHLQGDIKKKIKELSEEIQGPKKGAQRKGPVHVLRVEGAGQLTLLGAPNAGKSALHARLTGSKTDVGPYPYTTKELIPGMLPYEDVLFQLVDMPPVSAEYLEGWIVSTLQPASGVLVVIDLNDPGCADHLQAIVSLLAEKKVELHGYWPGLRGPRPVPPPVFDAEGEEVLPDPFRIELPALLVANKCELWKTRLRSWRYCRNWWGWTSPPCRCQPPPGRVVSRWGNCCSAVCRSSGSTAKRRANPPTWSGPLPCARGKRCSTWRPSSRPFIPGILMSVRTR